MSRSTSTDVKIDSIRERKSTSGDEAEETIAMSEGGLSGDDKDDDDRPRHVPELKYTRVRLIELRSHPLAIKRPPCLDNPNNWAIVGHGDRKRSETPTEEDSRRREDSTGNAEKRRSNDPRERVKKEQDGIVLSPQRRSFISGCYVPPSQSGGPGRRPESPIGKPESSNLILGRDMGHREVPTARRIGSGRIPARDQPWEFREPSWEMREAVWDQLDETLAPEHGSFRPGGGTGPGPLSRGADSDRNHRDRDADLRHENRRRGFGWDFPRERDRDGERDRERDRDLDKDRFDRRTDKGRNERHERVDDRMTDRLMRRPDREDRDGRDDRGRRDDRDRRDDRRDDRYGRRRHDSREEEPEWFSAGPTSQHDTIELRGFEDIPEDSQVTGRGKKNTRTKANSRVTPAGRKNSDSSISSGRTASTPPPQEGLKKTSPDGKGDKSDKSRAGGPLATSSPDTKEKRAKQNKTLMENLSKDHKEQMDISEESSARVENGRLDIGEKGNAQGNSAHMDFNLDDFLKIDSLPLLSLNGGQAEATAGGSRFSKWFPRNSPTNDSMRTVPDELTSMLNDITEPTISIPSGNDLDSFFAPISPAASSLHQKQQLHLQQQQLQAKLSQQNAPNKLLEMLRRGSDTQAHPAPGEIPSIRDLEASGKIHSVEELEARMRPKPEGGAMPPVREPRLADPAIASVVHHGGLQQHMQHKEDEAAALKRLLKRNPEPQVGSDAPISASNNAIMNTFAGMQQTGLGSIGSAGHGAQLHSQSQSSQPYIPEELLMKLLQVQQQQQQHPHQQQQQQHQMPQQQRQHPQDMLTKLMNNARMSQQQMHQQPHQMHQQGNRRQGQMLQSDHYNSIQSSNRSPLPPDVQNLIANTPLNHDLLQRAEAQAILRGLAQREISVQNLVQQLQNPAITRRHQELLLSILKTQSAQRVPSPRDMSQHIMQTALIKKKLEEQKEQQALRKRQENHRSLSPNMGNFNNNSMGKNDKHPMSSPTPLAFTPTSVLKKMNAEKDGDQKIGRPILKSNNNFYSGNDSFPSQPSSGSQNHHQQMQGMPAYLRGPPPSQPQYNARSKMTLSTPPPNMSQTQQYNMNIMQARPGMPTSSNQRNQHMQSMHGGMQNQQHNTSPLQQMLMGAHYSNQKSGMSHGGSGDVSSNSNQLARWFSPEVLAQARSGPSIPAQGMLSVEEIERLQQAVPN